MKISRVSAALAALIIAPTLMVAPVSMAAVPAGIAHMQPIPPTQLIDMNEDGQSAIYVVKLKQTATNGTATGNGNAIDDDTSENKLKGLTGDRINGVKFKVRRITSVGGTAVPDAAALATNAGQKALADLVKADGTPKGALAYDGEGTEDVTGADGKADFGGLNFGLYEVSEVEAPAGVTKSETFYVALPLADHTYDTAEENKGTGWNYTPTFYPKNRVDTLEKTVDDHATTSIGSPITYHLAGSVSSAEPGKYVITDQLSQKVKLMSVEVKLDKAGTDVALTANDDYTLEGAAGQVGQAVKVTLTAAGLAKLKTAYGENAETKVVVTINGVIASIAGADNDNVAVPNKAYLIPNDSKHWDAVLNGETSPGLPSASIETKFGGIKIHKVAQSDNSVNLAGAKFKVYASEADADRQQHELTFLDKDGNEVTEVTTGADGLAVIEGLRVSDFINGKATNDTDAETDNDSVKYWVVETVAPAGYSVLPEPIEVSVASADADSDQKIDLTEMQIENVKVNAGFNLPKTGLGGPFGFVLAGGVLLATGGVAIVVARRGRKQEA